MKSDHSIALLIPHYNSPEELYASIDSIKESIEVDLLIVDDGSKVKFEEDRILKNYTCGQTHFHYLEENQGIGVALNEGLSFLVSKGYEYIARLDCGDYCHEDRLSKQIDYLKKNREVAMVGSWANIVNEQGDLLYVLKHPTSHEEISKKMYLNNTFVHPSVVFRSSILKKAGNYPFKYRFASQDYAFFFNIMKHYRVENMPEVLVDYVISANSISTKKRRLQVKNRLHIIWDNYYLGFYPTYGLLRNLLLLLLPRWATTGLKKAVFKKQDKTVNNE